MLNLSDKELDRFSKEAAEEYEPGDVLGTRSWDRLESRINQEFGHPGWNPIQHIRRYPFYYAPALLVLLGVAYYLVRPGLSSGSSPGSAMKISAEKTSVPQQNSAFDKNSSTSPASTTELSSSSDGKSEGKDLSPGENAAGVVKSGATERPANSNEERSAGTETTTTNKAAVRGSSKAGSAANRVSGLTDPGGAGHRTEASGGEGAGTRATQGEGHRSNATVGEGAGTNTADRQMAAEKTRSGNLGTPHRTTRRTNPAITPGKDWLTEAGSSAKEAAAGSNAIGPSDAGMNRATPPAERQLSLSRVQPPHMLGRGARVSDSALRAFNAKTTSLLAVKGGYRISRNWQFGWLVAPDFTSVNSLAGDKAGSSFGLTVDYQFAPHFYIGTGILATRKNYAARSQDYHAPPSFYQSINGGYFNYVKGSFYMMEIPLDLRYDFSVAGNTLFFVSAGVSSYVMTSENANFYWNHYNIQYCNPRNHLTIQPTNLFSAVNLSAGVETGLSNSFSLLIAPYIKIPSRNMGLGQVPMNSVGINFALKFSPITGRKKH